MAESNKDNHAQLAKSHIDSKRLDYVTQRGIIISNETRTGVTPANAICWSTTLLSMPVEPRTMKQK